MCISCTRYPLVKLKNGKKKTLFNEPIQYESRKDIEDSFFIKDQLKLAKFGLSKFQSLNNISRKEDIDCVISLVSIPCGRCSECLQARAREWSFRILVEAEQHKERTWFLTLTYDDDHVPKDRMLKKDEVSIFNKALKQKLNNVGLDSKFRFYAVGEYGGETARCHYHGIYFGLDIPDLDLKFRKDGKEYYNSSFLSSVWNKGFVVVSEVDVSTACYVARYCDKKKLLTKEQKEYLKAKGVEPEYSVMSRRPGIGSCYTEKIVENVKNNILTLHIKDNSFSIPRYYTKKFEEVLPEDIFKDYTKKKLDRQMIKAYNNVLTYELINKDKECSLQRFLFQQDLLKIKNKKKRLN